MIKKISRYLERRYSNSKFYFKIYATPYIGVLNREIKLSGIKNQEPKKPILNVGCGSMPFTAYYLAKKTGYSVIAIDQNQEMIEKAKKTIKTLEVQNKIQIKKQDAVKTDYSKYQAVFTALHTQPKKQVYRQYLETAEPETPLLIRKPRGLFKNHYDQIDIKPIRCTNHLMLTFDKTCLYMKE